MNLPLSLDGVQVTAALSTAFPTLAVSAVGKKATDARAANALRESKLNTSRGAIMVVSHKNSTYKLRKLLQWSSITERAVELIVVHSGLVVPCTTSMSTPIVVSTVKGWYDRVLKSCDLDCGSGSKTFVACPDCHKAVCSTCFVQYARSEGGQRATELKCPFCRAFLLGEGEAITANAVQTLMSTPSRDSASSHDCGSEEQCRQDTRAAQRLLRKDWEDETWVDLLPEVDNSCTLQVLTPWLKKLMTQDSKVVLTWCRMAVDGIRLYRSNGASNADFVLRGDTVQCSTMPMAVFNGTLATMAGTVQVARIAFVARRHRSEENGVCMQVICAAEWGRDGLRELSAAETIGYFRGEKHISTSSFLVEGQSLVRAKIEVVLNEVVKDVSALQRVALTVGLGTDIFTNTLWPVGASQWRWSCQPDLDALIEVYDPEIISYTLRLHYESVQEVHIWVSNNSLNLRKLTSEQVQDVQCTDAMTGRKLKKERGVEYC